MQYLCWGGQTITDLSASQLSKYILKGPSSSIHCFVKEVLYSLDLVLYEAIALGVVW